MTLTTGFGMLLERTATRAAGAASRSGLACAGVVCIALAIAIIFMALRAGGTGFLGRKLVRMPRRMRGAPAFGRNLALFFRVHGGKTAIAGVAALTAGVRFAIIFVRFFP